MRRGLVNCTQTELYQQGVTDGSHIKPCSIVYITDEEANSYVISVIAIKTVGWYIAKQYIVLL